MAVTEDSIRSILKTLESKMLFNSLYELEKESGIKLRSYGKEIDFFYEIVMEGRFDDINTFITPLANRNENSYHKVSFAVKRQEFLEKLENSSDPQLDELIALIKEIEKICSQTEFNNLCTVLSLNKLTDHPEYSE